MPELGRLESPDARDRGFPMRALIPVRVVLPKFRYFTVPAILDQGNVPACVGYACKGFLISSPVRGAIAAPPSGLDVYHQAQAIDGWPLPHEGTSVRAGLKVLQDLGRIASYHWTWDAIDVAEYILTTSTVVLGTNWYNAMFAPDDRGFVHPQGPLAGGHAYHAIGYNSRTRAFRCINSWGDWWGQKGRFWLAFDDLQRLLNEGGEAAAALEAPL